MTLSCEGGVITLAAAAWTASHRPRARRRTVASMPTCLSQMAFTQAAPIMNDAATELLMQIEQIGAATDRAIESRNSKNESEPGLGRFAPSKVHCGTGHVGIRDRLKSRSKRSIGSRAASHHQSPLALTHAERAVLHVPRKESSHGRHRWTRMGRRQMGKGVSGERLRSRLHSHSPSVPLPCHPWPHSSPRHSSRYVYPPSPAS